MLQCCSVAVLRREQQDIQENQSPNVMLFPISFPPPPPPANEEKFTPALRKNFFLTRAQNFSSEVGEMGWSSCKTFS